MPNPFLPCRGMIFLHLNELPSGFVIASFRAQNCAICAILLIVGLCRPTCARCFWAFRVAVYLSFLN